MKLMKRILKYSLLGLSLINGMNCFGMEHKEERKVLNLKDVTIEHSTDQLVAFPNGFKISWTKMKLLGQDKQEVASVHYFSFDNPPTVSLDGFWKIVMDKQFQSQLPLIETVLKRFGNIQFNSQALKNFLHDKDLMGECSPKDEMFKDITGDFSGCASLVYIEHLEINPEFQSQGLGQRLAAHIFLNIMKKQPESILCWMALPLYDASKKAELYMFYKRLGAKVREDLAGFAWIDARKWVKSLQSWGVQLPQQSKI